MVTETETGTGTGMVMRRTGTVMETGTVMGKGTVWNGQFWVDFYLWIVIVLSAFLKPNQASNEKCVPRLGIQFNCRRWADINHFEKITFIKNGLYICQ